MFFPGIDDEPTFGDSTMATPHAPQILISEQQEAILSKITRQTTADFREVSRARLILKIGEGQPNSRIARTLNCGIPKVRHWRLRWMESQPTLQQIETDPEKNRHLEQTLREILSDAPRAGAPATYSSEEYCQILAIALEPPEESGHPLSQWSHQDLADECKQRGITSGISARQIGRFLKRSRCQTSSKSLLAQSPS
ncbi:helix-turn-helix domain-containing protein [Deltaproteobacteria bacterium TL4]